MRFTMRKVAILAMAICTGVHGQLENPADTGNAAGAASPASSTPVNEAVPPASVAVDPSTVSNVAADPIASTEAPPAASTPVAAASTPAAAASSSGAAVSNAAVSSSVQASSSRTASSSASASASAALNKGTYSVASTVLILAKDDATASTAYNSLIAYQIPYQVLVVPQAGVTLPPLNSSTTAGNFGAIVLIGEVSYDYGGGAFRSALTNDQLTTIYNYQVAFGVRMVRLDVYPGVTNGCTALGGTASDGGVYITNSTSFKTANLVDGAKLSVAGIWHYPAKVSDPSMAWEVAAFGEGGGFPTSTAIVLNKDKTTGREQIVYFLPLATAWSQTSNFLMHIWIHYATRGLYTGFRRVYLGTQIDDLYLTTALYKPDGELFRLRTSDMDVHRKWQLDLNTRLPKGSNYFIEFGANGNGPIQAGVANEKNSTTKKCSQSAIIYDWQPPTELEFIKPLGTGVNVWPTTPTKYPWSADCGLLDPLLAWFMKSENKEMFAHMSHTFTHGYLNNSTYSDVVKEIQFNLAFFKLYKFDTIKLFSKGLIPPAITGMHNGDAIKAFMENGIKYVVGDNTRPVLRNQQNPYYPLISTKASNGYDGLVIIPRWSSAIYYNCASPACCLAEWVTTSGGTGDFSNLMSNALSNAAHKLLGLYWDPYMFHQANLRVTDADFYTIGGIASRMSLLQIWTETIVAEMMRLTTWPIVTLKHDDIGVAYVNRVTRDTCKPKLTWNVSNGKITGATLSNGSDNKCSTPLPVTFPGPVKSNNGGTVEQRGTDPLTIWTNMKGSAVSFTLNNPISL